MTNEMYRDILEEIDQLSYNHLMVQVCVHSHFQCMCQCLTGLRAYIILCLYIIKPFVVYPRLLNINISTSLCVKLSSNDLN